MDPDVTWLTGLPTFFGALSGTALEGCDEILWLKIMVPYTAEQQSTLNMMMRRRVILLGIIYSLIKVARFSH